MRRFSSFQLLWLIFGVIFATCYSVPSNEEVSALKIFREEINEDPNLVFSSWNAVLGADPCDWVGISCSDAGDHVVKINISGSSLKGFLVPELGALSFLQELILRGNNFMGIIPKEIGMLSKLKVLDLGMNQLLGPIPHQIGNLTSIVKINLQSNGLTGQLPPELGNLKYLEELWLDRNKLQGTVPAGNSSNFKSDIHGMYVAGEYISGLCHLSQLKVADFSYNFFVGSIPKCL